MKRFFVIIAIIVIIIVGTIVLIQSEKGQAYGKVPAVIDETDIKSNPLDISQWERPPGPLRVGLQAGHWKTAEMPDEQKKLKDSGGGTAGSGKKEWEVNLAIAQETAKLLEREGIAVDILPSTIPPSYYADAFVSIHADGSLDPTKSGYKVASPRRDVSGKAKSLAALVEKAYGEAVDMPLDPNITRNMTGYYAFSWRRYTHAIHPMTPAVILETGFLTNPIEAQILITTPQLPAQALAKALLTFLETA